MNEDLQRAAEILGRAERIAVLTGAGISAESGVPTFRASDGLWEGHRIADVATPRGFRKDPRLVWNFYHQRRANVLQVEPNPGHYALVTLERHWGNHFTLITQNVDGLHRRAGSERVLEIHGSLFRTRCTECEETRSCGEEPLAELPPCPNCNGLLRPDIVWFEEMLPEEIWSQAIHAAENCDVLLVVGTSALVYPAASVIPRAKRARQPGATVIECNLTTTAVSSDVDLGLYLPSGQTLPILVEKALESRKFD